MPFPPPDRSLVGFECAAGRVLTAPAELLQDSPHVAWMVAHTARLSDQAGNPLGRPEARRKAQRLGAALEPRDDLASIGLGQLRLPSGAAWVLECGAPSGRERRRPAIHGLPVHADPSDDLRLAESLLHRRGGLRSPLSRPL